jgi:hypothetical protein
MDTDCFLRVAWPVVEREVDREAIAAHDGARVAKVGDDCTVSDDYHNDCG